MTAPQLTNRARWEAQGLIEQYVGGYKRTISIDKYLDDAVAQKAWRAGYEDWLQDVGSERIKTATTEELSREFVFDLGDFVDVSVGAVTWVNAARSSTPKLTTKSAERFGVFTRVTPTHTRQARTLTALEALDGS
ncbi:hypothetical protein PQR75_45445 [Paraburkholderia fungorum]|uniref:hypothetical protein n=1 Tax=Paraburkholderia fungorum TaxID=134537 RepID=UPI0038BC7ECD